MFVAQRIHIGVRRRRSLTRPVLPPSCADWRRSLAHRDMKDAPSPAGARPVCLKHGDFQGKQNILVTAAGTPTVIHPAVSSMWARPLPRPRRGPPAVTKA
jgi:hypothetical protein